jgi:p-aminobenzoyl-glutamate transporter AbgT
MVMGHRLIHAAILAFLLLNILLTVLVSLDMAKRAKFNGLWIPILLIAGLPGSAVYAIFRLGDIVAEAKRN